MNRSVPSGTVYLTYEFICYWKLIVGTCLQVFRFLFWYAWAFINSVMKWRETPRLWYKIVKWYHDKTGRTLNFSIRALSKLFLSNYLSLFPFYWKYLCWIIGKVRVLILKYLWKFQISNFFFFNKIAHINEMTRTLKKKKLINKESMRKFRKYSSAEVKIKNTHLQMWKIHHFISFQKFISETK